MSEEKIIQHSQKAVDLLKNHSKSIKEKIGEFLEEIVIIVVAVSLTLAFHNWNDRRKEKEIDFERYIGPKAPIDAAGEIHIAGILNDPEVRYHIFFYRLYLSEKQRQKKDLAKALLGVADEIDKELHK